MTLCCQCSGVTPPPPPNPGACCSKVLGEIETQCDDDVAYGDCLVREMGIHHPDKTCAQLRIDNGYPSQRTDWPEPACDLLGSCCFYFYPAVGSVNRACQNAVPSGTCEVGEIIGGRQNWIFHRDSYLSSSCPDGSANGTLNCKICEVGGDECAALSNHGPVTIVQDHHGGPDNGYPIFSTGVPCSCNHVDSSTPLYQDACCPFPPPPPPCDVKTCCYNEGEHCFAGICGNLECCSDEGGPLSCPDYPTLPNFTCDQLAECLFTTWPSTGWELIEPSMGEDCRSCKSTTTTTTTEAPRGACCGRNQGTIIDGACVGGDVWCFDNSRLSDCEDFFQTNGCVLGFHENKICSQVDCNVTTTTTSCINEWGGDDCFEACKDTCDYVVSYEPNDFGSYEYQWVLISNNCGNDWWTKVAEYTGYEGCCCPDINNPKYQKSPFWIPKAFPTGYWDGDQWVITWPTWETAPGLCFPPLLTIDSYQGLEDWLDEGGFITLDDRNAAEVDYPGWGYNCCDGGPGTNRDNPSTRYDCGGSVTTTITSTTTTTTTTVTPLGACCWWSYPGPTSICNGSLAEYTCGSLGDYPEDNTWHPGVDCDSVSCETTTSTTTTTTAVPLPTTSSTTTTTGGPDGEGCYLAMTCCPDGLIYINTCCGSDGTPPVPDATCDYPTTTITTSSTTTTTDGNGGGGGGGGNGGGGNGGTTPPPSTGACCFYNNPSSTWECDDEYTDTLCMEICESEYMTDCDFRQGETCETVECGSS